MLHVMIENNCVGIHADTDAYTYMLLARIDCIDTHSIGNQGEPRGTKAQTTSDY